KPLSPRERPALLSAELRRRHGKLRTRPRRQPKKQQNAQPRKRRSKLSLPLTKNGTLGKRQPAWPRLRRGRRRIASWKPRCSTPGKLAKQLERLRSGAIAHRPRVRGLKAIL